MRFNYCNEEGLNNLKLMLKNILNEDSVIFCIGTNREIADSLAPFVGMILKENGCKYSVYGTIDSPIHALNLENKIAQIKSIHPNAIILAIDAGIDNDKENVGSIIVEFNSLKPGIGVKKELPTIGDISIIGIVASKEEFFNSNVRLNIVLDMAKAISYTILNSEP